MLKQNRLRRHTLRALAAAGISTALIAPASAQTPQQASSSAPPTNRLERSLAEAAVTTDYVLSVGDKLRIEVYKDAQLSQALQVRPDGKITLPLIGDVVAAGLTPIGLDDAITKALREYVTNPVVAVIVVEATPPTVYVMGEVTHPGPVAMRPGMTALEALSLAGGFKDFAKTSDIRIIRRGANSEPIRFNYKNAIKGDERAVALKPGDTIVVP
jgi:polysaccharide export outer membrane protein